MRQIAAAVLLLPVIAAWGQATAGTPKPILQNSRVTVSLVELRAGALRPTYNRDALIVIVGGDKAGSSAPAEVFYEPSNLVGRDVKLRLHAPMRMVTVEFASPQGTVERPKQSPTRYCNPGSKTACVEEKYLLCTAKVCVEEVAMGAGAVTTRHSHDTDHMIIAVSDYSLSDDVVGKGVVMRDVKSGGVEYTPAGITHTLTNKSGKDIRFVVVVFR